MTPHANIAQMLGTAKLFGKLDEASRLDIARQMREASFSAGQSIFARGDAGTEVYLVLDGRVRLSVLSSEGRELSFTHAARGDVFGEIAALDGGVRTADATAVIRRALSCAKMLFILATMTSGGVPVAASL